MINVYTQPQCSHCDRVKHDLTMMNEEYQEINVREDEAALDKLKNDWGYRVTPVVEFEDGYTLANPSFKDLREALDDPNTD